MRFTTTILAACLCAALVNSLPMPNEGFQSQDLDRLMVVEADNDAALRSKRTIGLLRQLFPEVSKMIEDKVNMIIGEIVKIFGPVVIQGILGGNKNGGGGGGLFGGGGSPKNNNAGTTVNAKNPFDDDDNFKSFVDDDEFFGKPKEEDNGSKISLTLPEIEDEASASSTAASVSVTTPTPTTSERPEDATLSEADSVTLNAIQV